jgi:hypothetical protein
MNFYQLLSNFLGHFCPSWIRIRIEYGSGSGSRLPIEYGSNTDPDPDPQPCLRMRILAEPKGYFIFLKLRIGSYNDYQAEVSPVPA